MIVFFFRAAINEIIMSIIEFEKRHNTEVGHVPETFFKNSIRI